MWTLASFTPLEGSTLDEARALYGEGKIAESAAAFRSAAEALESDDPATAANARNNACVLWRSTGDLDRAEEDCRHALRLRSAADTSEPQAKTYSNLGLVLQRRAAYDAAREAFDRALELNRQLDLPAGQAIVLSNLGVNAIQAGWYAAAIETLDSLDRLIDEHAGQPWTARQRELARANRAVVYERLGAYREALRLYDETLAEGAALPPGQRATLSVNRAVALRNLGDPVRAEQAYAEAERTYRELGDRPALLNVVLNRALVQHLNLEQRKLAEPLYREALELAETLGEATQRLQCLDYLGRFLLDETRVDEAENVFKQAHALALESGSSEALALSLEGLGRCELERGDHEAALEHALSGIDEIEQVRGALVSSTLKASYHAGKRATYALAVEALARDAASPDTARRALGIAHRAKQRELIDRLGLEQAFEVTDAGPDVAPDRLLLEYFVAGDRLFGWLATGDVLEMRDLGPARELFDEVHRVHDRLSRSLPPDPESVVELTRRLIAPFETKSTAARWIIATDRDLDSLPFEILADPSNEANPLVARVDLGYLPSGAMIAQRPPPPRSRAILGIGDPRRDAAGPASVMARRFDLGPLHGAAEELESLSDWIDEPVRLLRGASATEEAFAEAYAAGAAVVHVATHTVLDEGATRSSAILLSAGPESDGLLRPEEIARLEGSAGLTVLAACRSAAVEAEADRAFRGLTGAFLVSGSAAVVATLWDVGDEATRVFMEQFYHQLGRGLAPDSALAEAKRTMIADPAWNDPSIWAAYVLVGNAAPVSAGRSYLPYALALLALVVGTALAWRYGRTSKTVR